MPVSLEQSEARRLIRLEGAIDIACAAELKTLLLTALSSGGEVCVSLGGATGLNATSVQLLWAAERRAREEGIGFAFVGPVQESLSISLGDEGFNEFFVLLSADSLGAEANCQA